MAKPLFQDIVPPEKRGIKRVPVPDRPVRGVRRPAVRPEIVPEDRPVKSTAGRRLRIPDDEKPDTQTRPEERNFSIRPSVTAAPMATASADIIRPEARSPLPTDRVPFYQERDPYRRRFPWKAFIVLACAIVVIGATYLVLSHFAKATVTISPLNETVTLNNNQFNGLLLGSTTPAVNASTTPAALPGQIQYQVISVVKDGAMSVDSTGQTSISTNAAGSITIFNNYSSTAQKLVANTRFQTSSGLIYRISAPVSVPGKKGSTPGSVTVTVTADQPGSQYNIGLSDFVLPGFSGSPQYTGIYARSKTSMTGGFSGIQPTVDPATLAAAEATIDAELESTLLNQVQQETPTDEIILPNAYLISYAHLPTSAASSSQAIVNEEGTIHAFAFNTDQLASQFVLAGTSTNALAVLSWQIPDTSGLNFSIASSSATGANSGTIWTNPSLAFEVSGPTTLNAVVNTEQIKEDLAGKPKGDFDAILKGFPAVANAQMTIQPFWEQYFPTNLENIIINPSQ